MAKQCKKCGLHKYRRKIVRGRGDTPADILFIGEAPGKSEDACGLPFIGPSGKLLREAIADATKLSKLNKPPRYHITNAVRCYPLQEVEDEDGDVILEKREPTKEEAWACRPYLEKLALKVKAGHVVFLGKVAEKFCKEMFPDALRLRHPAYILRQGGIESGEYSMFRRQLVELFREVG